jgi:hypothetical protein
MKKQLLRLPEGFALYAEAVLNRAHSDKEMRTEAPSQEETLIRMRSKGLYIMMDESPTRKIKTPRTFPRK